MDMHTRLPLAMKVVKIQEYEGRWFVPLLEQAQRNLGTRGHISTIVIDRGYVDGEDLWRVGKLGVIFFGVGKGPHALDPDDPTLAKSRRARGAETAGGPGQGEADTHRHVRD